MHAVRTAVEPARRLLVMVAAAVALAFVRLPGRPHTLCLLRATTGIPCPLCGGTTAAVDAGRADLPAALAANPLVVLGAAGLVLLTLPQGRRGLAAWRALPSSSRAAAGFAVLATAELWQLFRFGLL